MTERERRFRGDKPLKPRLESLRSIIANVGELATGKRMLVSVDTNIMNSRRLTGDILAGLVDPRSLIVDDALRSAVLGMRSERLFEEHYGLDPGTIPWNTRPTFDITQANAVPKESGSSQ
jgi:hypothetical protein